MNVKVYGHPESNRYCHVCGYDHGPLYICEHYSDELKAEIARADAEWCAKLMDPVWCQEQIDKGLLPPEGITIFRWFAGLS